MKIQTYKETDFYTDLRIDRPKNSSQRTNSFVFGIYKKSKSFKAESISKKVEEEFKPKAGHLSVKVKHAYSPQYLINQEAAALYSSQDRCRCG